MNVYEKTTNRLSSRVIFLSVASAIILGSVFGGGVYVGRLYVPEIKKVDSVSHKDPEVSFKDAETDFSPFWKAWNIINEKYVPPNGGSTTDPLSEHAKQEQKKVWGAIQGLVASLGDPHSVFMPPEEAKQFEENISGNFGGIGIEIGMRNDILTVVAPIKGTPAFRAGVLAGDKIVFINETPTLGMSVDEAVGIIRGEIGTPVDLTLVRKDEKEPVEVTIVRDTIVIPTIDTESREDGIFIIKLYNFSATAPNQFRDALREFVLSGKHKLILDLRGNPGGFLQAAVEIASWFLPAGKIVVTEDYGGKRENIVHRSRGYDVFNENLRMVILVNEGTASASEIVAGALSEHDIARLVGENTFGKGSVQELEKVTPDSSLKITVAHWKTPDGNSISKGGLSPEFKVEITREDREKEKDPQLEKALKILLE